MAEQNTAQPPAVDVAAIAKQVTESVLSQVGKLLEPITANQKVLADTLAKLPPAPAATAAAGTEKDEKAPKGLTVEEAQKLFSELLAGQQKASQATAAREAFISANLAKLPKPYQGQLGTDPAKWAEEAKSIQKSFEDEWVARGGKLESLGGAARDGGTTAATAPVDTSKLPAFERIQRGLEKLPVANAPVETKAAGTEQKK